MRFRFSRRALVDLEEIGEAIAQDKPIRAVTFIQELRDHCRSLVQFPRSHRLRPELGEAVRMSVFGPFLVLYVIDDDLLEIRRVVHGARDLADLG